MKEDWEGYKAILVIRERDPAARHSDGFIYMHTLERWVWWETRNLSTPYSVHCGCKSRAHRLQQPEANPFQIFAKVLCKKTLRINLPPLRERTTCRTGRKRPGRFLMLISESIRCSHGRSGRRYLSVAAAAELSTEQRDTVEGTRNKNGCHDIKSGAQKYDANRAQRNLHVVWLGRSLLVYPTSLAVPACDLSSAGFGNIDTATAHQRSMLNW